jgi:hypothetical protein
MGKYQGTIIEQSLENTDILKEFSITKTWTDEDWILHDIEVDEDAFLIIQRSLANGPWYVHMWRDNEIVIIYKEKIFRVNRFDRDTWKEAIAHGLSIGIPKEQLDFLTQ